MYSIVQLMLVRAGRLTDVWTRIDRVVAEAERGTWSDDSQAALTARGDAAWGLVNAARQPAGASLEAWRRLDVEVVVYPRYAPLSLDDQSQPHG